MRPASAEFDSGLFPYGDGWGWLYRSFEKVAPAGGWLRRTVCRYFHPNSLERWRDGLLYNLLGVAVFGALIPTGGIAVRRLTRARMAPYTLAGCSARAARAFYYKTCVFEALHLPFLITMAALSFDRATNGRPDLAMENTIVNLLLNVYPVMHHRRTRTRIVRLLERRKVRVAREDGSKERRTQPESGA